MRVNARINAKKQVPVVQENRSGTQQMVTAALSIKLDQWKKFPPTPKLPQNASRNNSNTNRNI